MNINNNNLIKYLIMFSLMTSLSYNLCDNYLLVGSAASTIFVLLDKIFPSFIIKE